MQPLTTLAQPAWERLGTRHHLGEGDGTEPEALERGKQLAEEQGKERSGVQADHHHGELKLIPVSSAQLKWH